MGLGTFFLFPYLVYMPLFLVRLVSCGLNNVRFWRVKGGALRSCPVDLGEHHHMHFTDIQFQPGLHRGAELADKRV